MEEQVSQLSELEGLSSELDGLLSDLKGREESCVSRIRELEARLEAAGTAADSAAARLSAQVEALSGALQESKSSLTNEISRSAALFSEREDLAARLDSVSRILEEEKARSSEKDLLLKSVRAAAKDKEAEAAEAWSAMEGLRTELALERDAVKDREARLQRSAKVQEVLEQKLDQAVRDASRSEEGFLLKLDLVKKELQERARRSEELERSLAAAGARIDELLEEAARRESLLAETPSSVLEKFRAWQAALSDSQAALRRKEEENAALRGREDSFLNETRDAEKKWKLAEVHLHDAVSKLRAAANENEISAGRIRTLEAERDKLRSEIASAAAASQAAKARAGAASGLMAALEEQAAKYAELLGKYDDLALANGALSREKSAARAEADSLRSRLEAAEAVAAGSGEAERARGSRLFERARNAEALLKKKEFELEEARAAMADLESECEMLRRSRLALGEKYAAEIQAENAMVKQARERAAERDRALARLAAAEEGLKKEAETLGREKQKLLETVRKKPARGNAGEVSQARRLLAEKEDRLTRLREELEKTRTEKAQLEDREKSLKEELKASPYRAMLREAEDTLFIKEKMLAELNARMKKLGGDFEELKRRGQAAGGPGYSPDFEELVAGVAHQIANSISIIRSHAEFCADSPEAEGARESLPVIVRNIVALQNKIDTIMNFSRPIIPQRSPEKLSAIAAQALESLRAAGRLGKANARVEASGELPLINVDRVRLAAAIEQLLLNAAEAMPRGGEILLKLSSSGGSQRLEIIDTGEGVEKKNLGAVFHPFFTTRPGKMGLGLTLARNVASAHGGTLELAGEPGRGARAVLELPEA